MTGIWAVLVREIRERRAIPLAALVLGFLPVVVGLIPTATRIGGPDVRDNLAFVLGLAFPTAAALGLGASVIGRDVGERRMGFYFSRPISGFALWAGKMGATFVLLGASALLVSLPAHVMTAGTFVSGVASELGSLAGAFFGLGLGVLALCAASAHAVGTMLRSRAGLLPVDLGLLITTIAAFAAAAWRITEAASSEMLLALMPAVVWGALGVLLVAGAAQVVGGRSDGRRGHLFLSVVLWGSLLAAAGVLHAGLSWVFATSPADIAFDRGSAIACAPRGSQCAVTGLGRWGYSPTFLVDANSGRFVRIGATRSWVLAFAPRGQTAVWLGRGRQPTLGVAMLDAPSIHPREVPLPAGVGTGEYPWILAVSPEGDRVLAMDADRASVVETASGRLVAQAMTQRASMAYFESEELVRLFGEPSLAAREVVVLEWNLRTGQMRETGRFGDALRVVDRRGGHLLVATVQQGLEIRSAETGQLERTVLAPSAERAGLHPDRPLLARFLADGRIAVIVAEKDGGHLNVFAQQGGAPVDALVGRMVGLLGESIPGELVLQDYTAPGFQTLFVDATTGEVRKKENGLQPVASWWREGLEEGVPGSMATRLFISDGALVDRDPVTGVRRVVIQGQKSRPEE